MHFAPFAQARGNGFQHQPLRSRNAAEGGDVEPRALGPGERQREVLGEAQARDAHDAARAIDASPLRRQASPRNPQITNTAHAQPPWPVPQRPSGSETTKVRPKNESRVRAYAAKRAIAIEIRVVNDATMKLFLK